MPKADLGARALGDELGEALRAELLSWPGVTIRPMMGCVGYCRVIGRPRQPARKGVSRSGQARESVPLQMLGCYVNRELSKKKPRWMNRPGEATLVWVRLGADDADRALRRPGVTPCRTGAKNWIEIPLENRKLLAEAVRWFGRAYKRPPRPRAKLRRW